MNEIFRFFCELLLDESGQNPLHGIIAAGAALLERDPETSREIIRLLLDAEDAQTP